MHTISDTMHIHAPVDRCFLLSTNVELVQRTLGMRPVAGKTTGLVGLEDRITWYGWKFGLPQIHESIITAYERPTFFQDAMARGKFKRFQHDHSFTEMGGLTVLNDKVRFSLPLGWIGEIVARRLVVPYISRLVHQRLRLLKRVAESDEWRQYLPSTAASDKAS